MKRTSAHWSLLVTVSLCLVMFLVPWQTFGQGDLASIEEAATEVSDPASLGEEPEETPDDVPPAENDAANTEDESVPEEGTEDENDEGTDASDDSPVSTETPAKNEDDTTSEAESPSSSVIAGFDPQSQTDEVTALEAEAAQEEEITPLAVYSGTCGTSLNWTLDTDTGVLSITGTGVMRDFSSAIAVPWVNHRQNIATIELPDGLRSIGNYAFNWCSLTSITIPDGVTSIGNGAFGTCSELTSIIIPDSVTSIGDTAFSGCSSLTSITISDSVTRIGEYAFSSCSSLASIDIPDSVTSIGTGAFSHCSFLASIDIPDSVTSIGTGTFEYCRLTSVTIPDSVTSIGTGTFSHCSFLASIDIPDSVTSIGTGAFTNCTSLSKVRFTSLTAPTVAANAFNSIPSGCTIYCPAGGTGYTDAWKNAIGGFSGATLVQPTLQVNNDELIFAPQRVGTIFPAQSIVVTATELTSDISCVISGSEASAFTVSTSTLPASGGSLSVTFAPTVAGTHEATLTLSAQSLPEAISVVVDLSGTATPTSGSCGASLSWSFDVATGVLTITGIGDMTDYTSGTAPWNAFSADITAVELPDGLTSIGDYAFENCTSLTSITIPSSVTNIGAGAFEGATSLDEVIFVGTTPPTVAPDAFDNVSGGITIHYPADAPSYSETWKDAIGGLQSGTLDDYGDPVLQTDKNELVFADQRINTTSAAQSITVTGAELTQNISCVVSGSSASAFSLNTTTLGATGGSLSITFAPTTTGAHEATLTLSSQGIAGSVTNVIALSGTASAVYSGGCGGSLSWSLDTATGVLSVTGTGAMTDYTGNSAPWHTYHSNITSLELPNGLSSIGNNAFYECASLAAVTIPDSVTTIGRSAFSDCTSLSSIAIPDSVTSIGVGAFSNCSSLASVVIPDAVTNIGSATFSGCSSLGEVIFESTAAPVVDASAFDGVASGCTIYYPVGASGYTDAWKNAISGLAGGTLIQPTIQVDKDELEFAVQSVGTTSAAQTIAVTGLGLTSTISCTLSGSSASAFALNAATLGATDGSLSVTFVPITTGTHTATLTLSAQGITESVSTVINLRGTVYSGSCGASLSWSLDIITGVLTITGSGAMTDYAPGAAPWYAYIGDISSVVLPDGITHIGNNAFAGATNIASVSIPDSVTSIGDSAFEGASSLVSVTLPEGLTTIGESAFAGTTSLGSITIPSSVTNIGAGAFEGAASLDEVIFVGTTPPTIAPDAFDNVSGGITIHYPADAPGYNDTWKDAVGGFVGGDLQDYEPPALQINIDEVAFAAHVFGRDSSVQTITISAQGLTQDITCAVSDSDISTFAIDPAADTSGADAFALSTTTLSPTGGTLTVSFVPPAPGSYTATLVLSSQGVPGTVIATVPLSGTASAAPSTDPPSTDPPGTGSSAQGTSSTLPQTSDSAHGMLLFVALIVTGGALVLLSFAPQRRKAK